MPSKRKSKTDKRAKARYSRYKRGGSFRVRKKKERVKKDDSD